MARHFARFRLEEAFGPTRELRWVGRIKSSLSGKRYSVRVTYPAAFPNYAPEITIEGHRFPDGVPHLIEGKKPCLYAPAQGSRHGYDPGRTTAATMVFWTSLWIHAYETWRETGFWPGSGV